MGDTRTYHEQTRIDQTIRLREVLKTLPPFAKDYFRAIEPKSSAKTRINYAYDVRVFFTFLWRIILYIRIIQWNNLKSVILRSSNL